MIFGRDSAQLVERLNGIPNQWIFSLDLI
jgi:hypothetical protein